MNNLVRCKVCGYIMEEGAVKGVCPACGVSEKAFEPYKVNMSERRFKLLSLHMHPIIVHFPQAFVSIALLLIILAAVTSGTIREDVIVIMKFHLLLLPFCIAAGAATGMYDGKLRFKKLTPPMLRFKMKLSALFLILSVIDAVLVMSVTLNVGFLSVIFIITLAEMGCAVVLGKKGSGLFEAAMPGK